MLLLARRETYERREQRKDTRTADQFFCDAARPSGDPTGTYDIRRTYATRAQVRFRQVRKLLQLAVVKQDVLGLRPETVSPLALAFAAGQRTMAFQTWVDNLLLATIIENDGGWMNGLIATPYIRAVKRGIRLTGKRDVPMSTDNVTTMQQLAVTELQGIVETVSQRIMRAAGLAYVEKLTPERAFQQMDNALMKVGFIRTRAMIGLMVVKAFTQGSLDQFEAAGFKRVGLIPETVPRARTLRKRYSVRRRLRDAPIPTEEMVLELAKLQRQAIERLQARMASEQTGELFTRTPGPGARTGREEPPSRRTVQRIRAAQRELEKLRLVNIVTAGDEKVCQVCQDIEEDNPYTINEARALIPAHPECRCAFVPLEEGVPDDDDFLEE